MEDCGFGCIMCEAHMFNGMCWVVVLWGNIVVVYMENFSNMIYKVFMCGDLRIT